MKKPLPKIFFRFKRLLWTILVVTCFSIGVWGQTTVKQPGERKFNFPKEETPYHVDFKLKSTGVGKFDIQLKEARNIPTRIKIYTILGDLIIEDVLTSRDGLVKSYDFSGSAYKLFVVEVGNSKYNNTRSVYNSPPGSREGNSQK